jgi:hypothetical protein
MPPAQEREAVLRALASSQKSLTRFCKARGLSAVTVGAWRLKYAEAAPVVVKRYSFDPDQKHQAVETFLALESKRLASARPREGQQAAASIYEGSDRAHGAALPRLRAAQTLAVAGALSWSAHEHGQRGAGAARAWCKEGGRVRQHLPRESRCSAIRSTAGGHSEVGEV